MGSKSSKAKKQVPPAGKGLPRTPSGHKRSSSNGTAATPAWEKQHKHVNGQEWGNTSYNLLDLQSGYAGHRATSLPGSPVRKPHVDKYAEFRKLTEKRNIVTPPPPVKRSPKKKISSSPRKRSPTKNKVSPPPSSPPRKRSPIKVRRSASPVRHSRHRSPVKHRARSPSPVKSPPKLRRRSSFPAESPKKKPSSPSKKTLRPTRDDRRLSDVSTIDVEDDKQQQLFRPIQKKPTYGRVGNGSGGRPSQRLQNKGKPLNKYSGAKPNYTRGTSYASLTSDHNFTNIAGVKSATHSVESTRSNFNVHSRVEKFPDKKTSLAMINLAKMTVLNNTFHDSRMPAGGPQAAYDQAKKELNSQEWEIELSGIEKIVTITRRAPEVLRVDLKAAVRLMINVLRNLRSQVCRAAAQAWAELFLHLGKSLEPHLDTIVPLLLQKSADTNKFIREGCVEALFVMAENITIQRVLLTVSFGGLNHKSVMVRAQAANIMDKVVTAIGSERFFGSSRETQVCVLVDGTKLLGDGSLEVRTHAKHMFAQLVKHAKFESLFKDIVAEKDRKDVQKTLDSLLQ